MPRQPFTPLYSLSDCIRDKLNVEVECLTCGHRVAFDPEKLRQDTAINHATNTNRFYWTLPDYEHAFRCSVCKAKQCRMQLVDSVDDAVYAMKKPAG
jgi:hypothetical protein